MAYGVIMLYHLHMPSYILLRHYVPSSQPQFKFKIKVYLLTIAF